MKKNLTELVFIVDRSGSMAGLEKDTVGGINSTLKKQKKIKGDCLVSTVFFNDRSKVIHDRVSLDKVEEIKEEEYYASGCTALMDALGDAIKHIKNVHKYIRKEDVPNKTMFVITTDGYENASRKYSSSDIKRMIKQQKKEDWEFIYLAANIDAYETARDYGIDRNRAVNYVNDSKGNSIKYECVNDAIVSLRECNCLNEDWDKKLKKDYKERGLKNKKTK